MTRTSASLQVFASEGDWRTVVRRETWDDLLARDV